MFSLWALSIILSTLCTVYGVWDQQCVDNCSCCVEGKCGSGIYDWTNVCTIGCIDGHRGARCYDLCQYVNCKSCGFKNNDITCTACYNGRYLGPNKDCTSQCPSNCKSCISSTMCTECKEGFYNKDGSTTCKYAYCPGNCECNGQGYCISCKKGYYDTSSACTKQCPFHCVTCESEESCNECKAGFYNGYEYDNNMTPQLHNCTFACSDTCKQCQSYKNCSQCINGKYGSTCQKDCSVGCKDKICLFKSGYCACTEDFTGDTCMKCVDGKYGSFCNGTCPKNCKENICDRSSGACSGGCINENMTGTTCNACNVGRFDELCDKVCSRNCKGSRCERYSGVCSDGCLSNFDGTTCDQCISGKYGKHCELNCPVNCANDVCDRNLGICRGCIENFQSKKCDECKFGFYGSSCDMPCSPQCTDTLCNRNTGNCVYGCKNGFSGDKCCVKSENCVECHSNTECIKCVPGFFTSSCSRTCPGCCNGSCHISTGECILSKELQQQNDVCPVATAAVLGSLFALSLVVNIVQFALCLLKKMKISRRNHSQTERGPTYENQLKSVVEQFQMKTYDAEDTVHSEDVERNVYEGISSWNENEHEYQQVSSARGNRL